MEWYHISLIIYFLIPLLLAFITLIYSIYWDDGPRHWKLKHLLLFILLWPFYMGKFLNERV